MKIEVKLKNGWEGYLNKDVHVVFTKSDLDKNDNYSYTVPCEDIIDIKNIDKDYIPKKVIIDEIEELENEIYQIQADISMEEKEANEKVVFDSRTVTLYNKIKILKEILQENMEEENYNHIPRID